MGDKFWAEFGQEWGRKLGQAYHELLSAESNFPFQKLSEAAFKRKSGTIHLMSVFWPQIVTFPPILECKLTKTKTFPMSGIRHLDLGVQKKFLQPWVQIPNTAISYKVLVNLHSRIGRIGPEIASYDECLLLWATFVLTTFLYLVKKLVKTLGVLILFLEL